MTKGNFMKRVTLTTTVAAVLTASIATVVPAIAVAQPVAGRPANDVTLSVGAGQMVRLNGTMSDLFVADDKIADVQVRSSDQIYIFGKSAGETTVYATNKAGKVVYSANVRVGTNIGSVDQLLRLAMPDARIQATPMNGMVLLTGTVATPSDVEEAGRIVQSFVGEGTQVISRIKTATPLQVNLQVKIAEVSRSLIKEIGVNLLTRDMTGGFLFGVSRGRAVGTIEDFNAGALPQLDVSADYGQPAGTIKGPFNPVTGQVLDPLRPGTVYKPTNPVGAGTAINLMGNLFGLDILSAIDLAENDGRVSTLAEPNLTALSGETASFLAGGEFPIPTASGINGTSVEFKEYGVSLAFTPTVLEGGRISMRVRPEVSELSSAGAIKLGGFEIPGLTTRRAETTVELGSGQSFMIGGLIRNSSSNTTDKAPWLGDLPILGALFRSNGFKRNETELVIIVTPYLVKPVNAGQIALPTDGFRTAKDGERIILDQQHNSRSGEQRPRPTVGPAQTVAPAIGQVGSASVPRPAAPAPATKQAEQKAVRPQQSASATPGFTF
jgi:pilus assembly protein CpaC